jgi:uncharacterized protein (DUF2164 family)
MVLHLPKEQKTQLISYVQQYFREERDEEIGDLAAKFLIDFMIKHLGPLIYNRAIDDVQAVVTQKMASLEEDIYALKMPMRHDR